MPACQIDHLTVTAPSLALGAEYVSRALGVALHPGGEHPRMGTHNLLLRLGDALFLEVIAVNPEATAPARPRWFGLDELAPSSAPQLATWVARTDDIRATVAAIGEDLGLVETMTRGALQWLITIPSDGRLPLQGAAPALIEWQVPVHPAASLRDVGCSLRRFEVFHPEPARVGALLAQLGLEGAVQVSPLTAGAAPHLLAHIDTPGGLRVLGAPMAAGLNPAS